MHSVMDGFVIRIYSPCLVPGRAGAPGNPGAAGYRGLPGDNVGFIPFNRLRT